MTRERRSRRSSSAPATDRLGEVATSIWQRMSSGLTRSSDTPETICSTPGASARSPACSSMSSSSMPTVYSGPVAKRCARTGTALGACRIVVSTGCSLPPCPPSVPPGRSSVIGAGRYLRLRLSRTRRRRDGRAPGEPGRTRRRRRSRASRRRPARPARRTTGARARETPTTATAAATPTITQTQPRTRPSRPSRSTATTTASPMITVTPTVIVRASRSVRSSGPRARRYAAAMTAATTAPTGTANLATSRRNPVAPDRALAGREGEEEGGKPDGQRRDDREMPREERIGDRDDRERRDEERRVDALGDEQPRDAVRVAQDPSSLLDRSRHGRERVRQQHEVGHALRHLAAVAHRDGQPSPP